MLKIGSDMEICKLHVRYNVKNRSSGTSWLFCQGQILGVIPMYNGRAC